MKTTINVLLVIISIAFFSCQKNESGNLVSTDLTDAQLKSANLAVNDIAVESATEEASYETYFYGEFEHMLRALAHVKGNKHDLLSGRGNLHYMNGQHPVVSIDTAEVGYPITITIDYGDGTETKHGKVIKGLATIEITGPKNVDGTMRNITFSECMIDSIGVDGTSTETFNGDNTTTRIRTIASNVDFTLPDGTVLNREGSSVKEWLAGLETLTERDDDRIQITGTTNISSSTGDTYSRTISVPVIRLGDCSFPVEGVVKYNQNDTEVASLDYGDGTCDNLAILTTGGDAIEITLKEHSMPKVKMGGRHKMGMHGNND